MRRLALLFTSIIDDLLYLVGCGMIVYATSLLSIVAALYVAGGLCILAGVLIGLSRIQRIKQ